MASTSPRPRRIFTIWSVLSLCVLLTMVLAACGGSDTTTTSTSKATVAAPKDLLSAGTLTVGSDTTYPPQESIDPATGKAVGFDIDIINEIGKRLGLNVTIQTAKFDSIIDSLSNKRFDVVISAVTINADREKKVDFVPYFYAGESLLVQKGNPKNLKTVADLCGQPVGVQNGTVEQPELSDASKTCQKNGKPAISITVLQDQTAVVQLLATNRVVATYQDSPVTDYYNKLNPGQFQVGGSVVNAAQEGIVIRKGDTEMMKAIQTAFNQMKADGTYQNIINKWGLKTGQIS